MTLMIDQGLSRNLRNQTGSSFQYIATDLHDIIHREFSVHHNRHLSILKL